MKTLSISLLLAISVLAQDKAPALTDAQKLTIVTAERDLAIKQAEKAALESRLKELDYVEIPKAQQALSEAALKATPQGYQLQNDLTLKALPTPVPAVLPKQQ